MANPDFAAWRARLAARLAALPPERVPVVLIACGSFNPPTRAHLRLFPAGATAVDGAPATCAVSAGSDGNGGGGKTYAVVGGLMSPVGDGYGKIGLAPAVHRLRMCQLATARSGGSGEAGGGGEGAPVGAPASDVAVHSWEATREGGAAHTRTLDVLRHIERELNSTGDGAAEEEGGRAGAAREGGSGRDGPPLLRPVHVMLLAGTDLVESMRRPGVWFEPDALLREHGVVCVERPAGEAAAATAAPAPPAAAAASSAVDEALLATRVLHAGCDEEVMTGVSSSRAREALRAALNDERAATAAATSEERARRAAADPRIAALLDARVAEYAALHGVYAD